MCGRFTVNYTYDQMLEFLNEKYSIFDLKDDVELPRYNVSPGQQVLSIISDGNKFRVGTFKWGFVSDVASKKVSKSIMINTRSETIENKVMFKDSFLNKRCIVLSDGFYEWDNETGTKKPFFIGFKDKRLLAYAGIWSKNKVNGKMQYTCSILTTKANDLISEIHNRMPVILTHDNAIKWLDKEIDNLDDLKVLFKSYDSDLMFKHEVSKRVNKVSNDDIDCIKVYNDITLF